MIRSEREQKSLRTSILYMYLSEKKYIRSTLRLYFQKKSIYEVPQSTSPLRSTIEYTYVHLTGTRTSNDYSGV